MSEAVKLFKALGDGSRFLILQSLAKEDMYVERLAERLGLAPGTVSFHLKKLEEVGAVTARKEQYYTMYALCPEAFSVRIIDLLRADAPSGDTQDARDAAYRQKVLDAFLVYGKLKKLPAQRKKKNIILEEIATSFAFDRGYTEKEVNVLIADYHEDVCTIRRDMIGAGLLSRAGGIYRKECGAAH